MAEVKKGLVEFKYLVNHGLSKKGDTVVMHYSTAKALETHKIGTPGKAIKVKKNPK